MQSSCDEITFVFDAACNFPGVGGGTGRIADLRAVSRVGRGPGTEAPYFDRSYAASAIPRARAEAEGDPRVDLQATDSASRRVRPWSSRYRLSVLGIVEDHGAPLSRAFRRIGSRDGSGGKPR